MRTRKIAPLASLSFVLGVFAAYVLARGAQLAPSMYEGRSPKEAAAVILKVAEDQAGKGTWELIRVGRVFYLSGEKEKGQAIFDKAIALGGAASDWLRLGRVYLEAGDFDKAEAAYNNALAKKKESQIYAELGTVYNMTGKREKAEEMFRESLKLDDEDVKGATGIAGSYVGVKPLW